MPSQYPILDNKPIDQWRVAELREELRRRKLATKGLKEELVKRLDEAIQKEMESENEAELGNGAEPNSDLQNNTDEEDVEVEEADNTQPVLDEDNNTDKDNTQPVLDEDNNTDKDAAMININHGVLDVNQGSECQNGDSIEVASVVGTYEEKAATTGDLEGSVLVNQSITSQSGMQGEDAELEEKSEESKPPIVGTDEKEATTGYLESSSPVSQNIIIQSGMQGDDAEPEEKFEELKHPIVGTDEKAATEGDFEGSSSDNQKITAQSCTQSEDAEPEKKLEELISPIVGADEEKESTTSDLEGTAPANKNITAQFSRQGKDAEPEEKLDESKPLIVDSAIIQTEQSNQVSEVQDLGLKVKYESNSTDSVSINEKNNMKDNLTVDFPLELEVVKQEVVQPSSGSYPTGGGDSCMAVDEQEAAKYFVIGEQEGGVENQVSDGQVAGQNLLIDEQEENTNNATNDKYLVQSHVPGEQEVREEHASVLDADTQNVSTVDPPKKEDCVEAGSPEKLNLDRSSGDESMEEDILESKPMEVDIKSEEPASKSEAKKVDAESEERTAADAMSKFSPEMKDVAVDVKPAALTEKRKLEEVEVGNNVAPKRHRRWNPDIIKVPEQQTPHLNISMTPKNSVQPTLHRTFSRSNSILSVDSPKERIVPTSKKPATTSLRIDNFLRPFTLKAVQELLAQTGDVRDFWMDHIKTHCYVTYSSVEHATETRNAVYNLQWPSNGGRLLAAEFVDPQEVKSRLEAPPQSLSSPTPATPKAPPPQQTQTPQPIHQQNLRQQQQLPPPPPLTHPPLPPPPLSNPPIIAREQRLPPPPPKKAEPPVVTLDDIFKKTRATPRIYYLPLTEEQVGSKLAAQQGKSTTQV